MNPTPDRSPVSRGEVARSVRILGRLLKLIEDILGACAAIALAVLLAVVLVSVGLRYCLSTGFIGAEDLGIWLHVALIAIGAPLSLSSALAMRLDVFVRVLPQRFSALMPPVADSFTVLAALILLLGGSKIMTMLGGTSPTLGIPEWIRFGFLGLGGGLVLVVLFL